MTDSDRRILVHISLANSFECRDNVGHGFSMEAAKVVDILACRHSGGQKCRQIRHLSDEELEAVDGLGFVFGPSDGDPADFWHFCTADISMGQYNPVHLPEIKDIDAGEYSSLAATDRFDSFPDDEELLIKVLRQADTDSESASDF